MKTLRSEEMLKNAARLNEVIAQRKRLEKEEKALKALFISELDNTPGMLKVGDYGIMVKEMCRTILSSDLVILNFGAEGLKLCQTESRFLQLDIVAERTAEKES